MGEKGPDISADEIRADRGLFSSLENLNEHKQLIIGFIRSKDFLKNSEGRTESQEKLAKMLIDLLRKLDEVIKEGNEPSEDVAIELASLFPAQEIFDKALADVSSLEIREELKKPDDGSISPEDLERTLDRLDKLVEVRKERREKVGLSHASLNEKEDGSESYRAINSEIIKIRNRLKKIKDGAVINSKDTTKEVSKLKEDLLGSLASYRAEMKSLESEPDPIDPPEPDPVDPEKKNDYEKARTVWLEAKKNLKDSEEGFEDEDGNHVDGYFSDANKTELKNLAQTLKDTKGKLGLGKLYNRKTRKETIARQSELAEREALYNEAKQNYIKALHGVLEERKKLAIPDTDEYKESIAVTRTEKGVARTEFKENNAGFDDYKATIAAHFFAKQGDAGYRGQFENTIRVPKLDSDGNEEKDGDGNPIMENKLIKRDLRSYHEKEQAFNESVLPEKRISNLTKLRTKWDALPAWKKVTTVAAIGVLGVAARSVFTGGIDVTRMVTGAGASLLTRWGIKKAFDNKLEGKLATRVAGKEEDYAKARAKAFNEFGVDNFFALTEMLNDKNADVAKVKQSNERWRNVYKGGKLAAGLLAGAGAGWGMDIAGANDSGVTEAVGDLYNNMTHGSPDGVPDLTSATAADPANFPTEMMRSGVDSASHDGSVVFGNEHETVTATDASIAGGDSVEGSPISNGSVPPAESFPTQDIYTIERGDNFWDLAEGQTGAPQPNAFSEVAPDHLQALIDLTRDRLLANPALADSVGIRSVDNPDLWLFQGDQLDLTHLNDVAQGIAEEQGWLKPDINLEVPVASPDVVVDTPVVTETPTPEITVPNPEVPAPEVSQMIGAFQRMGISGIEDMTFAPDGRPMGLVGHLGNLGNIHENFISDTPASSVEFNYSNGSLTANFVDGRSVTIDGNVPGWNIELPGVSDSTADAVATSPSAVRTSPVPTPRPEVNLQIPDSVRTMVSQMSTLDQLSPVTQEVQRDAVFSGLGIEHVNSGASGFVSENFMISANANETLTGLSSIYPSLTDDVGFTRVWFGADGQFIRGITADGTTFTLGDNGELSRFALSAVETGGSEGPADPVLPSEEVATGPFDSLLEGQSESVRDEFINRATEGMTEVDQTNLLNTITDRVGLVTALERGVNSGIIDRLNEMPFSDLKAALDGGGFDDLLVSAGVTDQRFADMLTAMNNTGLLDNVDSLHQALEEASRQDRMRFITNGLNENFVEFRQPGRFGFGSNTTQVRVA